ncbi:MAG: flagellar biosynthesis anti-sigma factor FlgM [Betaproteobacteria bacterium]|nr:flagellar biosynthesis anti-sigma factor FlgM [Betaproteobacteria bacterium]
MTIGAIPGKPVLDQTPGTRPTPSKAHEENPTSPVVTASSVNLSGLSAQLHGIESRVADGEGFNVARVEEIKSAIRSGAFKVNAEAVADGLIRSVKELVGK